MPGFSRADLKKVARRANPPKVLFPQLGQGLTSPKLLAVNRMVVAFPARAVRGKSRARRIQRMREGCVICVNAFRSEV